MARITPTDIALLTNAALDFLVVINKIAPDAITPENIDDKVARRQAEIDALEKKVNG